MCLRATRRVAGFPHSLKVQTSDSGETSDTLNKNHQLYGVEQECNFQMLGNYWDFFCSFLLVEKKTRSQQSSCKPVFTTAVVCTFNNELTNKNELGFGKSQL